MSLAAEMLKDASVERARYFPPRRLVNRDLVGGVHEPLSAPAPSPATPLSESEVSVKTLLRKIGSEFVEPAINTGSPDEFFTFWNTHWGEVLPLLLSALNLLAEERVAFGEVTETEEIDALIRSNVVEHGGEDAAVAYDFVVGTFGRAIGRLKRLLALPPPPPDRLDKERACAFNLNAAQATYAVATLCLISATMPRASTVPSVVQAILETLRHGALLAYRYAADGLSLRKPAVAETEIEDQGVDEALLEEHIEDAEQLLQGP